MYCNPLFMIQNGQAELCEELKSELINHSKLVITEQEAPIRLSENVAYVQ